MKSEIFVAIFNSFVAMVIIVRMRPVFMAQSYPELIRLVDAKPNLKKVFESPFTRAYWFPIVLGIISLFSIIDSVPDELVEQDGNADNYLLALLSLIFLMIVWFVHIWRLRKLHLITSEVARPLPVLDNLHVEKSEVLPVPATNQSIKGKIRIAGVTIAAIGVLMIGYAAISNKKAASQRENSEKFKADFAASLAAPVTAPVAKPDLENGTFDANAEDSPTKVSTSAGPLEMGTLPNGDFTVFLNQIRIFNGDNAKFIKIVRHFKLANNLEVVLLTNTGARGNSCESLFTFLSMGTREAKATPLFGTCAAAGSFTQIANVISISLPEMGGYKNYSFDGVVLKEDGKVVELNGENDPSQ